MLGTKTQKEKRNMSLLPTRILSATLFKQLVSNVCTQCIKNVQKHITRSITDEHVIKLEETFLGRLLVYINNEENQPIISDKREIIDILRKKDKEIENYNTDKIISVLTSFSNYHYAKDRYEFSELINMLDNEFCKRVGYLKTKEKFNILHAYMKVMPNKIIQYNYYKKAVEELFNQLDLLDKKELVQLIFYIGLQKKSGNSQYLLKRCMKSVTRYLNDLTTEDLCIICNSTFKTSTKINKIFLDKVINHISDNLHMCKDPAILITLIKTIRHNRYASEDLLTTLSYTVFFNKTIKYYSFSALCHILALYADFFYYDENLTKAFTDRCIQQLKDSNSTNTDFIKPRVKDIKRFIWCLYNMNYKLKLDDIKNILIPNIMKKLESGEFENDSTSLIDIMLYLWALNYKATELVPYVLTKENIQLVKASKSPAKNKLNLLLSCIYFEDKLLYRQINSQLPENPKYDKTELNERDVLRRVLECLQKTVALQSNTNKFEVGYQVPYLKIMGITGYRKNIYKTVNIEVLDEYTSLKNTDHLPIGLMQLKLRLLKEFEEALIVISANEVDSLTDKELCSFLLDEINFVS